MVALLTQKKRIRTPIGAGVFYPEEKSEMLKKLNSFGLGDVQSAPMVRQSGLYNELIPRDAKAVIAPHGAWNYSGQLAADVFSSAMGRKNIKRVVILGPIHNVGIKEKGIFLSNSHYFNTPIGNLRVDKAVVEELEFYGKSFEVNDIPHLGEHSIEILLPFVKYCFPNAKIVPILMGHPTMQRINDLAKVLKTVISPILDETLIVVSCNISSNKDEIKALRLAQESLHLFSEKNAWELSQALHEGRLNACGGALVVSLIESGLLEKTTCSFVNELVSVASSENRTVYYSSLSYS